MNKGKTAVKAKTKPKKNKLPYGKVNVRVFQWIKKQILKEPTSFYMKYCGKVVKDDTYYNPDIDSLVTSPTCKTVACIGGWALAYEHLKTHKTLKSCKFTDLDKAVEILGLKVNGELGYTSNWDVFYLEDWPVKYRDAYNKQTSLQGKAKVAARFIDYVCGK